MSASPRSMMQEILISLVEIILMLILLLDIASNINKVQIAVNGNTDMIFREKISLSNVFDRNLDLVYETEELQS